MATFRNLDLNEVIETFLIIQDKTAGSTGYYYLRTVKLLFCIDGNIGGKHHVDVIFFNNVQKSLLELRRLEIIFTFIKVKILIRNKGGAFR